MGMVRTAGLILIAIGFLGFMSTSFFALTGTYINPAIYIVLGVLGVVVIFSSLIYERIQDERKDDDDDLSQY
ncbi:hypothetical protein [Desulfuribacillus alkaliarsenatis]|uniref:Uncharacterized protein n=1 Tax=Desulfuribacillus alkaliarsenatis TaxID=766136 RepID=A0A1E5G229_9FIRM|nr:hypothetical protein [Desulfuribacillus alkaliarsenatis]OEF97035.1 hypothetical protein BHF68_05400 [Desulfuribacillus alkaliarsenatis]